MTEKGSGGGELLTSIVMAYLTESKRASAEKVKAKQQAKAAIAAEKEMTARYRIHADMIIASQREETERTKVRCNADVEIVREKRIAFESLCDALANALRTGEISLNNIRAQFGNICQLLIEKDVSPEDRRQLIDLLDKLLTQQDATVKSHTLAIQGFNERKLLDDRT